MEVCHRAIDKAVEFKKQISWRYVEDKGWKDFLIIKLVWSKLISVKQTRVRDIEFKALEK